MLLQPWSCQRTMQEYLFEQCGTAYSLPLPAQITHQAVIFIKMQPRNLARAVL